MKIPEDYIDFLYWFKEKTEKYWNELDYEDENYNESENQQWIGLKEEEIFEIEDKYKISFSYEHREFLKVLHDFDTVEGYENVNHNDIEKEDWPHFMNWKCDAQVKYYLNWPYKLILEDVKKHRYWLKSWGKRPESEIEIENFFNNKYSQAPKLLPIYSHRFVVNVPDQIESPVLSIMGIDTVHYGWSMKDYLLKEFGGSLDIYEEFYDEEYKGLDIRDTKEYDQYRKKMWSLNKKKKIPFWSEVMSQLNSNYPYRYFDEMK
ncbi:hypothetical protein [Aureibacter tunicatorum]|uniref:Knr4/Smi1-like domain-containing protein n=1 Tax=Aureibacter tunicatorum TaxID=866807 RepID=A0AAE4BUD6_9BACT|nr:hypothetical protein [Aureibacter tunicatorum]MDR6240955.1 hypothetical protein [Aureibacter tunicatorum]BDD03735.1 hypothetical protein AUTU_12180 [Aureibacter tunicatorum]